MKKKIIGISILTTFITIISLNMHFNKQHKTIDLFLSNVEAIASSSEGGSSGAHTLDCGKGTIKMCEATCGRCQVTLKIWGAGSPGTLYCPLN